VWAIGWSVRVAEGLALKGKAPGSVGREHYGSRAVAFLRQGMGKGYKDPKGLEKNKDLDALRSEDFRKLLAEAAPSP
jgi:hypothetical protein